MTEFWQNQARTMSTAEACDCLRRPPLDGLRSAIVDELERRVNAALPGSWRASITERLERVEADTLKNTNAIGLHTRAIENRKREHEAHVHPIAVSVGHTYTKPPTVGTCEDAPKQVTTRQSREAIAYARIADWLTAMGGREVRISSNHATVWINGSCVAYFNNDTHLEVLEGVAQWIEGR